MVFSVLIRFGPSELRNLQELSFALCWVLRPSLLGEPTPRREWKVAETESKNLGQIGWKILYRQGKHGRQQPIESIHNPRKPQGAVEPLGLFPGRGAPWSAENYGCFELETNVFSAVKNHFESFFSVCLDFFYCIFSLFTVSYSIIPKSPVDHVISIGQLRGFQDETKASDVQDCESSEMTNVSPEEGRVGRICGPVCLLKPVIKIDVTWVKHVKQMKTTKTMAQNEWMNGMVLYNFRMCIKPWLLHGHRSWERCWMPREGSWFTKGVLCPCHLVVVATAVAN